MSAISNWLANPVDNFSTTLSSGINSSDVTIPVNSVTGLPTEGIGVIFAKDSDGNVDVSTIEFVHWTGISSLNITLSDTGDRGLTGSASGAQAHGVGSYFEVWVSQQYYASARAGFVVEHNANGTHKALTDLALTTPQITTSINDANGNEVIKTPATASAVNEVTVTNAATGNAPSIAATGGDTNIDLNLTGKGTGKIKEDARYGAITTDSDGATITFDMAVSNLHTVTLGGNRTLAVSNVSVGQTFIIRLVQDGTGSRTVTWFSTIKWAGGVAPTLTTTASKADTFGFLCTSSGNFDGFIVGQNI